MCNHGNRQQQYDQKPKRPSDNYSGKSNFGMQAAQQQGTVSQEIARQTDGVLLAVGALSSVLKKKVSPTPTAAPSCVPHLLISWLQHLQPH